MAMRIIGWRVRQRVPSVIKCLSTRWYRSQTKKYGGYFGCIGGGGGEVGKKEPLSAEDIEYRRLEWVRDKVMKEHDAMRDEDVDEDLIKFDRMRSDDYATVKSLWKDMVKLNRKKGVVPSAEPPIDMRPRYYTSKDNPIIVEFGELAVEKYNNEHNSELRFVRVISVESMTFWARYEILVLATDLATSRVPVKLQAFCSNTHVDRVVLWRPVPSVEVSLKMGSTESKLSIGEHEALLYANIHNCPVMDRRLGLRRNHTLYPKDPRGSIFKISSDDIFVGSVAKFIVENQSESECQVPKLEFFRVIGAFVEKFVGDRFVYHLVLEALEDGVQRRFYAAVSVRTNVEERDPVLMVWVVTDTPRATFF